jgi:hypothetical protein
VIIYCYSIGKGILKIFVQRKGPPPKVKKKFFKDKECKEKLWRGFSSYPSYWWDAKPKKINELLS